MKVKATTDVLQGTERVFKGEISSKTSPDLITCLNWYSAMADEKMYDRWLSEHMKKTGYSKSEITKIINLPEYKKRIAATIARMQDNGTIFVGEMQNFPKILIDRSLSIKQEEIKEEAPKETVSIQDRIKNAASQHIVVIDDEISSWYENRSKKINYSFYDYLQSVQISSAICNHVKTWVQALLDEHQEMIEGKDEQLNEAYAYLSAASKKEILKALNQCINDIERYVGNTKATKVKKPRQKKQIPVDKLINKLKFQKEFVKFKIKSIAPENIIGAQQLWIFNTRYNQLTVLNAIGVAGLTVKGTSIQNYDTVTSEKKKIRKPEEIIDKVLNGGKQVLKKLMFDLKTKSIEVNGRINDDCILLKAIK